MARLIGVDWGTTRLRLRDLARPDDAAAERGSGLGLVAARERGFAQALAATAGDLLEPGGAAVMSGMVGAREGWREAPYCQLPCGVDELARAVVEAPAEGLRAWIVPGVSKEEGAWPDVMRGEETQILGCLEQGGGDGVYVLPGTHAKWARVAGGRLADFTTYMTGDVYQALVAGSVLRLQIELDEDWDPAALRRGTERGAACPSAGELLALLFSGRTMGLFGRMERGQLGSYVLGMLLGAEIDAGRQAHPCERITLVGSEAWTRRYACACEVVGLPCVPGPAAAAFHGQRAIGARIAALK